MTALYPTERYGGCFIRIPLFSPEDVRDHVIRMSYRLTGNLRWVNGNFEGDPVWVGAMEVSDGEPVL